MIKGNENSIGIGTSEITYLGPSYVILDHGKFIKWYTRYMVKVLYWYTRYMLKVLDGTCGTC